MSLSLSLSSLSFLGWRDVVHCGATCIVCVRSEREKLLLPCGSEVLPYVRKESRQMYPQRKITSKHSSLPPVCLSCAFPRRAEASNMWRESNMRRESKKKSTQTIGAG
jgi:hypothetical protein